MRELEYPAYEPCGSTPPAGHWTMVKAVTCEMPKGHQGDVCGMWLRDVCVLTWTKDTDVLVWDRPATTRAVRRNGPRRRGR